MAVDMLPDLLAAKSDALAAGMQAQSCFSFSHQDANLLDELEALTSALVNRFVAEGLLTLLGD